MILDLSLDELLTTTRSVRKRLDLDRPVEREVVVECIDLALQAPTGSNRQAWHWVIVEDAGKKAAIAEHYRRNFEAYAQMQGPEYEPGDTRAERQDAVRSSATYLSEHFAKVPMMVIPCQWERPPDDSPSWVHAGYWGSLLPAVWSFMLALRSRGLGSAWTSLHLPNEREVAELLGIPYEKCAQAGLFPVAYTKGTDFKPAKRQPASDVIHWNGW